MGVVAHTLVIGSSPENPVTGRKADVIQAAYVASELALRMMKPGGENMIVTKTMQKVVAEFDCVPIEGTYVYVMMRRCFCSALGKTFPVSRAFRSTVSSHLLFLAWMLQP